MSKLKVLHAPVNIGNQPWALSLGERALGCDSQLVVNYDTWLKYPSDLSFGNYGEKQFSQVLRRLIWGVTAPFRFNVLHYYFGRSLMCWDDYSARKHWWYFDLKLAKRMGKKIFMTLQGCDVRLASRSNKQNAFTPCQLGKCAAFQNCVTIYDHDRIWLINNILPLVDQVFYLNPELGHFIKKGSFLPYTTVDVEKFSVIPPKTQGVIKIVHGPSDPAIKGTEMIVAALDELKKDFEFELILVKNKTHEEAMRLYQEADIAIDQILTGWYGAFAVELMAMGKPVLCYIRQEDLKFIPPAMVKDLALHSINPANLKADIAAVLAARKDWLTWSEKAREFVLKWHNPRIIAQAMIAAYKSKNSYFDIDKFVQEKNLCVA